MYELLKRKVYIGKVVHKNIAYDGIHEPILDEETFHQVQELLKENNRSNKQKVYAKQPSLLSGKIYDDNDFTMSPSHAVKNNKRYRYYLSQAYLRKQKELAGSLPQVPASEIEQASLDFVKDHLQNSLKLENHSIEKYQIYKTNLENYLQNWSLKDMMSEVSERTGCAIVRTQNKETHFIVRQIIQKVVISHINIIYYLNPITIQEIFELIITRQNILSQSNCHTKYIRL